MEVRHNVFAHCGLWALPANQSCFGVQALVQNETGLNESDNHINAKVGGATATTCDFDGDGINDTFHATGVTWWYESSVLRGRYVYLNQSTATSVTLGDRNGDGMCDVDIGGSVFYSPRNSSTGTALALHGGDNFLWRIVNGIGGWAGNGLSVAPGTSPAIASDGHGHWKIAFHALGNHLWTMDSTGALVNTGLPMASDANSPAIAALATGGYEIAFVGSDGYLWKLNPTYSDARWAGAGLSVAPGTSPAMAADGSGGWKIAFHALGDHLWTIDSADRPVDTGILLSKDHNSPAIAALPYFGYDIAYKNAADGLLWEVGPFGERYMSANGLGLAPDTSSSITAM